MQEEKQFDLNRTISILLGKQTLDFAKLLEEASKVGKSTCGELTGLIFERAVTTRFEITPLFGRTTDNGIVIELLPQYHIFVFQKEIMTAAIKNSMLLFQSQKNADLVH